jgi:hypothetical protein
MTESSLELLVLSSLFTFYNENVIVDLLHLFI